MPPTNQKYEYGKRQNRVQKYQNLLALHKQKKHMQVKKLRKAIQNNVSFACIERIQNGVHGVNHRIRYLEQKIARNDSY